MFILSHVYIDWMNESFMLEQENEHILFRVLPAFICSWHRIFCSFYIGFCTFRRFFCSFFVGFCTFCYLVQFQHCACTLHDLVYTFGHMACTFRHLACTFRHLVCTFRHLVCTSPPPGLQFSFSKSKKPFDLKNQRAFVILMNLDFYKLLFFGRAFQSCCR
jgi:hypothetical protein